MRLTQKRVNEALNAASENGYDFNGWTPSKIADDLADYDSDFEGQSKGVLPLVIVWLEKKHGEYPTRDSSKAEVAHWSIPVSQAEAFAKGRNVNLEAPGPKVKFFSFNGKAINLVPDES